MIRQFKSELLGKEGMRLAIKVAGELIREGLIIKKPTNYGLHVSLNTKKAQDIKKLIKDKLGYDL